MLTTILVLAGIAFLVFAMVTQYGKTPADQSGAKRAWLSVVAAAGVIGAAIMSWFSAP